MHEGSGHAGPVGHHDAQGRRVVEHAAHLPRAHGVGDLPHEPRVTRTGQTLAGLRVGDNFNVGRALGDVEGDNEWRATDDLEIAQLDLREHRNRNGDSVGIEILLEPLFKMLDILATAGQSLVGDLPDSI